MRNDSIGHAQITAHGTQAHASIIKLCIKNLAITYYLLKLEYHHILNGNTPEVSSETKFYARGDNYNFKTNR
jgi:hypothetical protein